MQISTLEIASNGGKSAKRSKRGMVFSEEDEISRGIRQQYGCSVSMDQMRMKSENNLSSDYSHSHEIEVLLPLNKSYLEKLKNAKTIGIAEIESVESEVS